MYDDGAPTLIWFTDSFIYLKRLCHLLSTLFLWDIVFNQKGSSKCVPVCFNRLPARLNFSASTTDRHRTCTDDVVTEMCNMCLGMLPVFLFFVFIVCGRLLEWHSISTCFQCQVRYVSVCLICVRSPQNVLFMCVCVYVLPLYSCESECQSVRKPTRPFL